jgi:cystathionine beta-synthase
VIDAGRLVGVVDESDLLLRVRANSARFHDRVTSAMTASPQTLLPSASIDTLQNVLDRGLVAIVADESGFHGLITRSDLLLHLRRNIT